jgi:hypothetical protein
LIIKWAYGMLTGGGWIRRSYKLERALHPSVKKIEYAGADGHEHDECPRIYCQVVSLRLKSKVLFLRVKNHFLFLLKTPCTPPSPLLTTASLSSTFHHPSIP